ncbi:amidohydrolase [Acidaminobacter sp. JC074]|uniref:amidohydrolase n=1 Tax=Acidaminobacter sp. JC074 TaxID=2530199 RepID=UPI001F0F70C2|nr:amidohydrolase [Acidaminobacter sp. JC074]MCH4889263.1 amidohydrolase [Acidaminobacter sp. JC074]
MLFIKNGKVLTMAGETYDNGSVLIKDGKILDVGNIEAPEGAEIIDAKGHYVLPGFIDAHCHLGMWETAIGFEGDDGNEITDPVTPHLRGIDAINPMDVSFEEARAKGGVTTVATGPGSANVVGGQFCVIKTYGDVVDEMVVKEPLAMKIAFGENPKRCYNARKETPTTRMGTAAKLREILFKAKEYKEKLELAKDDPSKKPAFDMKLEALLPVMNKEIPLKSHAHRADDIITSLRIAKEFDVNITLEHCTEGHLIADYIKSQDVVAVVGPTFGHKTKFELQNLSFETPKTLIEAGVKIAIMTDSPVIPLHHLNMCAALAMKAGLSEEDALKCITINAAEILELGDRLGSLEKGKDADVVIWDRHPFDLQSSPLYTIIDGEIVHRL